MLIHRFGTAGRRYVYDAVANAVLELEPVEDAVLALRAEDADADPVARLAPEFGEEAVRRAVAEFEAASREQGLFRPLASEITTCADAFLRPEDYETKLRHLTLTVTEACNLRCRYCLHGSDRSWVRPHGSRVMDQAVALKALRHFAERCSGTERPLVTFYGGEPLLAWHVITRTVEEAAAHPEWPEMGFLVATNGTLLDDAKIGFCIEHGVRLQISLDGPAHVHDAHRRTADGSPTHALVEEAVEWALRRDPAYASRLSFLATLAPPYDAAAVAEYFRDFPPYRRAGVEARPQVLLNPADLDGVPLDDDPEALVHAMDAQRTAYVHACCAGGRDALSPAITSYFEPDLIKFYHRSLDPPPAVITPTGTCRPGLRKLHVRADGVYQPCERVGEILPIGHVDEGVDPGAAADLCEELFAAAAPLCRECWAVRLCRLCFTAVAANPERRGADLAAALPPLCDQARLRAEASLRLYAEILAGNPSGLDFLGGSTVD